MPNNIELSHALIRKCKLMLETECCNYKDVVDFLRDASIKEPEIIKMFSILDVDTDVIKEILK